MWQMPVPVWMQGTLARFTQVWIREAPPGNEQVNVAHGLHELVGAGPGGVGHQAHQGGGQVVLGQGLVQGGHNGGVGVDGLLAPRSTQTLPRLEGQAGGVRGHIGPGLVDDGDDPQGDRRFAHLQPVGQNVGAQGPAHGVGQLRHRPDAGGHVGDPALGEPETVLHHRGDGVLGPFQVLGVGGQDGIGVGLQGVSHGQEDGLFLFCRQGRQGGFGRQGLFQQPAGEGQLGRVGAAAGKLTAGKDGRGIAGSGVKGRLKVHSGYPFFPRKRLPTGLPSAMS